jgi:hypothetical protein
MGAGKGKPSGISGSAPSKSPVIDAALALGRLTGLTGRLK